MKKIVFALALILFPTLLLADTKSPVITTLGKGVGGILERTSWEIPATLTPAFVGQQFFRPEIFSLPQTSISQDTSTPLQMELTRLVNQQLYEQASLEGQDDLLANSISTQELAEIIDAVNPQQTFLQGQDDLLQLFATDTSLEFFSTGSVRRDVIVARTQKDIDIADVNTRRFYTLKEGDLVEFSREDLNKVAQNYQQITPANAERVINHLREAARATVGKRSFLFPRELVLLAEKDASSENNLFTRPLEGKKIGASTVTSFIALKKDLAVLTANGLRFVKAGTFIHLPFLRLERLDEAFISPDNIEFSPETVLSFIQEDKGNSFFSSPRTYTDDNSHSYVLVETKTYLQIETFGTVNPGDFLDITQPGKLSILRGSVVSNIFH